MKAATYHQYGAPPVVTLTDIPRPVPKEDEILVKIHAATVTSGDVRLRGSDFPPLFWLPARIIFGLFRPKKKILGHELAGVVEATGERVDRFRVGDRVFGTTTMLPTGSHAEYICLPQQWKQGVIETLPATLSFAEAAALPVGGMTAIYLLEKGKARTGQHILVYGASGSVGSYAVQIAAYRGLTVTAVCSTTNFDMVKSLGATHLIDYRTEDYSASSEKYDLVFDAVGKTKKGTAKRVLRPDGTFVSVEMITQEKPEHFRELKQLAEEKAVVPFIDRYFDLDDIVAAHTYVDGGRKRGNVVIRVV